MKQTYWENENKDFSTPAIRMEASQPPIHVQRDNYKVMPHYYGDVVRRFFVLGSMLLLISFPLFMHMLVIPQYIPVVLILLFGFVAAWISPAQKFVNVLNTIIAGAAVFVFEYYASSWYVYNHMDWHERLIRILNLVLSINFFFAFYYGLKTVRGYFLKK